MRGPCSTVMKSIATVMTGMNTLAYVVLVSGCRSGTVTSLCGRVVRQLDFIVVVVEIKRVPEGTKEESGYRDIKTIKIGFHVQRNSA